jgi:hypothetical protein
MHHNGSNIYSTSSCKNNNVCVNKVTLRNKERMKIRGNKKDEEKHPRIEAIRMNDLFYFKGTGI